MLILIIKKLLILTKKEIMADQLRHKLNENVDDHGQRSLSPEMTEVHAASR